MLLPAGLTTAPAAPATATAPVAAAAAAATAPEAAATATEAAAGRLGTSLVHRKSPTTKLRLVELVDGSLRVVIARHLDEGEAPSASRGHVTHHADRVHRTDLAEHLFELSFPRFVREITHKQPATHVPDFPGARDAHPAPKGRGSRELARVALPLQLR